MRYGSKSVLTVVVLLACGMGYYYFGLFLPRSRAVSTSLGMAGGYEYGGDLYPIWLTGRELLLNHSNPYTDAMTQRIQTGLYGRSLENARRSTDPPPHYRAFAYPLYTDLLALPILPFAFSTVRVLLAIVLPGITTVSVLLWAKTMEVALSPVGIAIAIALTLFSYPVLEGFYALQPALWVGFCLAASIAAIGRNRLASAGALLAITFIKPQLTGPLAAWLLLWSLGDWRSRRRFALGLALGIVVLLSASELGLPGWYRGWYHAMVDYRSYTLPPLAEFVLGRLTGYAVEVVTAGITLFIACRSRRATAGSFDFNLAVNLVLAATILLLPTGGAVYDHVVLLGGILWVCGHPHVVARGPRPIRVLAVLLAAVVGWQWIASTGISLLSVLNGPRAATTNALLLPVRAAASLPFVLMALLTRIALQAMHKQQPTTTSAGAIC